MEIKVLKKMILVTICLLCSTSCATPPTSQNIEEGKFIFNEYKSYEKINNDLKLSSAHGGKYVYTFINNIGIDSFKNKTYPYKEGTISVKESYTDSQGKNPDNLYVMKKMPKGYDSENNDWYYAILDKNGKTTQEAGKISSCINCHKISKDKDYIYGFN